MVASIERSPSNHEKPAWQEARQEFDGGVLIRFIGQCAINRLNAREVRLMACAFLEELDVEPDRRDAAEAVLAEYIQNAERNGLKGKGVEVDVAVTHATGENHDGETVDITVANYVSRSSLLPDGTIKGMLRRNKKGEFINENGVVIDNDDPELLLLEHGYGLRKIVDIQTKGRWGYGVGDPDKELNKSKESSESEVQVAAFAVIRELAKAALGGEGFEKAA